LPGGPVRIRRGPTLSYGGPDPLFTPWRISSSLPRGGPGAIHVVGSVAIYHATRDSRAGTASSYCSKGTFVLGYRQWPPGSSQGRIRACRWG
jgi:hypothetical protein